MQSIPEIPRVFDLHFTARRYGNYGGFQGQVSVGRELAQTDSRVCDLRILV
jgi:hypothetical protein